MVEVGQVENLQVDAGGAGNGASLFLIDVPNPELPARGFDVGNVFPVARDGNLGVDFADDRLSVRTSDFAKFTRAVPRVARALGITLFEVVPTDESLESVFSYLVHR